MIKLSNKNGFTFVEIIAVLILVSIVGAVFATRISDNKIIELNAEGSNIVAHLRHAQLRAMNSNILWGIHSETNTTYYMFKGTNAAANAVTLPMEDKNVVTLPTGMTLTINNITDSTTIKDIYFDSWGKAYKENPNNAAAKNIQVSLTLTRSPLSNIITTIAIGTGFIQ